MANRTKQRRNQGLMLSLYQRVPHPEFFKILASEQVTRRAYDADIWLVEGGHVVSFAVGRIALAEACVHASQPVQERGLIQSLLCRGERYHEMIAEETIKYMISTQEEQLNQALYTATRDEIAAYAAKRELMTAETPASAECGSALSVLDVERRSHELLVQSFHLYDDSLTVIKTQGIFEVIKRK